ncbi:unnamed protein product [Didymodactylos carnosus]|uniref:Uncharacterized protein n=1 Tax=Didymodactylos carnosus TaxID=1234261 RepID=A0A815P445_9BILA|nr:unnamed protein product [Didymodactylos carnosus]CAF4319170.1 unnamed protein product [Didymodactylos carnosus]
MMNKCEQVIKQNEMEIANREKKNLALLNYAIDVLVLLCWSNKTIRKRCMKHSTIIDSLIQISDKILALPSIASTSLSAKQDDDTADEDSYEEDYDSFYSPILLVKQNSSTKVIESAMKLLYRLVLTEDLIEEIKQKNLSPITFKYITTNEYSKTIRAYAYNILAVVMTEQNAKDLQIQQYSKTILFFYSLIQYSTKNLG